MKTIKIWGLILLSGLFLAGCGTTTPKQVPDITVEKIGEIKTKVGDEYILSSGSDLVNIASYNVKIDEYMKKKVKVKGSFSGTTLYINEIQEVK